MKLEPAAAIEQLTNHQQQADMDGVFVTVSRQALEEVLDYLRTPPASQSDEALVEIARLVRDRFEDGGGCVDGPDWDWGIDECAKVADDVARAILPIITAREASAHQKGFESGFNQGHKFGRSLGKEEGRRKGIEEAAQEETGWLIEHADEPKWLILSTAEAGGGLDWTKDSNAAVRFARREDAEAYVWAHFGGDGPIRITEHRWG